MRVIAGEARSLPLKTPQGLDTRPTTDRIKETLFNMLQPYLPCSVFIDLCSGSGGIGIEAISRGARHAYFVENGREPAKCIAENLHFTKFEDRATLLKQDVVSALSSIHEKEADVIFMDPPYNHNLEKQVLASLNDSNLVDEDTLLIVEASIVTTFDDVEALGYSIIKEKLYKTNKHVFLEKTGGTVC